MDLNHVYKMPRQQQLVPRRIRRGQGAAQPSRHVETALCGRGRAPGGGPTEGLIMEWASISAGRRGKGPSGRGYSPRKGRGSGTQDLVLGGGAPGSVAGPLWKGTPHGGTGAKGWLREQQTHTPPFVKMPCDNHGAARSVPVPCRQPTPRCRGGQAGQCGLKGLCLASALWERQGFFHVLYCSYVTFENKRRDFFFFFKGKERCQDVR